MKDMGSERMNGSDGLSEKISRSFFFMSLMFLLSTSQVPCSR
jgi:hypothetical protein